MNVPDKHRIEIHHFPVFDDVLGSVVQWSLTIEGEGICRRGTVRDAAGRRIPGVKEVRFTDTGETLLVMRAAA